MKATMHLVPRSAEKIKFPTTAAIFPMTVRMLMLVALQRNSFISEIIFISRRAAYPLFLALTNDDDKATNRELHPIKSRITTSSLTPFVHSFASAMRSQLIYRVTWGMRARRAKRIRSRSSKKRAYIRAALP